jgi:hypothetical protein
VPAVDVGRSDPRPEIGVVWEPLKYIRGAAHPYRSVGAQKRKFFMFLSVFSTFRNPRWR